MKSIQILLTIMGTFFILWGLCCLVIFAEDLFTIVAYFRQYNEVYFNLFDVFPTLVLGLFSIAGGLIGILCKRKHGLVVVVACAVLVASYFLNFVFLAVVDGFRLELLAGILLPAIFLVLSILNHKKAR